jgi:hypothetical protein
MDKNMQIIKRIFEKRGFFFIKRHAQNKETANKDITSSTSFSK